MIVFLVLFLCISGHNVIIAQTNGTKQPPSFQYDPATFATPQTFRLDFKGNIQKLMAEDEADSKQGMPLRLAVSTETAIDLSSRNMTRAVLPSNEQIRQYAVRSNGAKGLIVTFSELYIPEGDELFAYTKDRNQVKLFTHDTNPSGEWYATGALYGDEIIFEYVQASQTAGQPRIKIADIAYIYRSTEETADVMTCYINVSCPEGDDWQLQKNGVVGLSIHLSDGWYICSGSLINNVREDGAPFILTANHCIDGYQSYTFPTMEFEFFKESTSTNCFIQSTYSSLTKKLTGATLLATTAINHASDGTLLQLTDNIPDDWDVYYNGWDARDIPATGGVSIHHPNGYVKKISTFTTPLVSVGNIAMGDGVYTGTNAHWKVVWASTGVRRHSVTYGGSSGSPIFNQDKLIVGTLTGGSSYCDSPDEPDYYGKFSNHWDKYDQKFNTYLDPDSTGTLVLKGYDPHGFILTGKPVATEATGITPVGFTANWEKLENANKYYLDVYQKFESDSIAYLDGFERKEIANDSSFTITGLDHATEYGYVVRAGYRNQVTDPSNEISVTTDPATFEYFYPVATAATDISSASFTANWETLPEATFYLLNVYRKIEATDFTDTVDFTNRKLPEGWTKNSISYYTQEGQYGQSAPAIRLGSDEQVTSPDYAEKTVKSLQFWYRGISASASNALVISGQVGEDWVEVKRIQPLVNTEGGDTILLSLEELPEGCTAIKIFHDRKSGYVALDDIVLEYGTFPYVAYIRDLDKYEVSDLLYAVDSLAPQSEYYYSIIGYNGKKYSNLSNEIAVTTDKEVGIKSPSNTTRIYADKNAIQIHTNAVNTTNVSVFNLVGQTVISRSMQGQDLLISRQGLPSGIYFVKLGTETYKILLP
ncbi:hypothetical protein FACS189440_18720 [Bacteroidia bacterium]|nr:hypothetical protein FACS189423_07570 [Bacteroidia bacterium]GHT50752.1 hypothetical protein FACS189440_18720 [Bacteroidia bacterium]